MPGGHRDWVAILERVMAGEALALLEVNRFVNGFLGRWGAYDFRDEWDDLLQEVVTTACLALRDGTLERPDAIPGYIKTITRRRFIDTLDARRRRQEQTPLADDEDAAAQERGDVAGDPALAPDVERALDALPEKQRQVVLSVYLEGRTYDDAAERTGIPLGSLKRYLRQGLAALRGSLAELVEDG